MRRSLSLALAMLVSPSPGAAQPAASTAAPEIIVTGRGLAAPAGAAAYAGVMIDRARLTSDASGRLEDVLRDVAGFQQFRRTDSRSANPTSQGATLRSIGGNASSRALVLLDGVPQADPFASFIPWNVLAPAGLGAVRVTRGGGAGPFGAGAVAGTI
jgi:iron complex outermembrane receptor protein